MAPLPRISLPILVPKKPAKANNIGVTQSYLNERCRRSYALGYNKPRWIEFCEHSLRMGLAVYLYEARHTASKYVTLRRDGKSFKVRFSDHKPIARRENAGDCDFFVGVTNRNVTTTGDAIRAVRKHFGVC